MKTKIIIKQINNGEMAVKIKGAKNDETINAVLNMLCSTTACECIKYGIKKTEFINYMKDFYDTARKDLKEYEK